MAMRTAKSASTHTATRQKAAASSTATGNAAEPKPNSGSNPNAVVRSSLAPVTAEMRRAMIAEAAYYIAEQRGFASGRDLEDWLLAERQIDTALSA